MKRAQSFAAAAALCMTAAFAQPAVAESFDWIMESISKKGSISNGDGHYWTFRKSGDGWEVVGVDNNTARVTQGGENLVDISGFPSNWNANGQYAFAKDGDTCRLRSKYSGHNMKWDC